MKFFFRNKLNNILRIKGEKAGIIPVTDLEHEDKRLDEVNRLGIIDRDLSDERKYNSFTQLATYLTGCERSMINILDSSVQHCKANFGFNMIESHMTKEMPREISVCQYSLSNPKEPLIIENLFEDERTKNMSKLGVGPVFQFYAGSPLITSKGYSIGTLCVLDSSPQKLIHQQVEGLRLLSDQIVSMIENESIDLKKDNDKISNNITEQKYEGKYYSAVSILFADFVGFTKMVEDSEPGELLETLNSFFMGFDKIILKHNVLKVKTIGDCYMCVSGIPDQKKSHAHEICSAAKDILQFVEGTNIQHEVVGKPHWDIRIGIHSGPVIAGTSVDSFDIWGDAVNIAARIESSGEKGKIHISEKTANYLEGSEKLISRGKIDLKNKGSWKTFFLEI